MNLTFKNIIALPVFFAIALNFGCATTSEYPEEFVTVSGTAAYRQRIAMPPDAILSVRIEDVSLADTKSSVLAEFSERFGDRQVPITFTMQVPNTAINANRRYNLRATISAGGQLRFTTTRSYPVLSQGAANNVELLLDAVAADTSARAAESTNTLLSGFSLPASFSGTLPCADCPGIAQTLNLRGDGLYILRRIYQDKPDGSFAEAGGWKVTANVLSLYNGLETSQFVIIDDSTLRQLDKSGQPISSTTSLDLHRTAAVDPVKESLQWQGEFQYMADAAIFTDCGSGLHWPVAMKGDYLAAERNYTKSSAAPGSSIWMTFKGRLELGPGMEGPISEQMVIEKFNASQPDKSCLSGAGKSAKAIAELKNTYWRLVDLGDQKIAPVASARRQVHITLASEGNRVSGFSGCNQFTGTFKQTGNELGFSQLASTMMACLSPEMETESQLLKVLNATTHYRIESESLFLLASNKVIARFESLYLR